MILTPERMAKARAPAPEKKKKLCSSKRKRGSVGRERTEASTSAVLEALPKIVDLNSRLTPIPPNHPTGLSETLLIVGKDDEVVEGGYGVSPWNGIGKAGRLA